MKTLLDFYSDKVSGLHRLSEESFLAKEAREKIFHLGPAASVLDFGCGTADLTAYYAQAYEKVVGADFSANMLEHARRRLDGFGHPEVTLIEADDRAIWGHVIGQQFDVITTAGVMQHLSLARFEAFLQGARGALNRGGRVVLFDLIDPRRYRLAELGIFGARPGFVCAAVAVGRNLPALLLRRLRMARNGRENDRIGFEHHPMHVCRIAERQRFSVEFVNSMYYEYRFHVLLQRLEDPSP